MQSFNSQLKPKQKQKKQKNKKQHIHYRGIGSSSGVQRIKLTTPILIKMGMTNYIN